MDDDYHHYDFEQESRNQVYIGDGIGGAIAMMFVGICAFIFGFVGMFRRK